MAVRRGGKRVKEFPARKPNRLKGYDYSQDGAYFVTVCAKDRQEMFSRIVVGDGLVRPELTDVGKEIVGMIDYINVRRTKCKIVQFVIMPNHVHFIIRIVGRASPSPTIGTIVGGLKSGVSRVVGFSPWQRFFHDHIIRNDNEYNRISDYIQNNPALWHEDCFYPK